jgi:tetraacyldisaccharide 4'-kinase
MHILERLYHFGYQYKKQRVLARQQRLPHPVISIGNITVGGTGKTPATIALAEESLRRGYAPIILTRGYRGRAEGPCFVSIGRGPMLNVLEAGDEPVLMANRLPGVPVIKSADRFAGGMFALDHLSETVHAGVDKSKLLFLLDDGFQHWKLARDVDIVLIDGTKPFGNRRLLPLGPLREPLEALRRAGILVLTKAGNEAVMCELTAINPGAGLHSAAYVMDSLLSLDGSRQAVNMLQGKQVFAFSGIANPKAFRKTVESTGCTVKGFKEYPDHYAYRERDLLNLSRIAERDGSELLVTTEKDLVKCSTYKGKLPLCALIVSFAFDDAFFNDVFARIG